MYKGAIQTKGDYSPGTVEGDYRIGDTIGGNKFEVENMYFTNEGTNINAEQEITKRSSERRTAGAHLYVVHIYPGENQYG